MPLTGTKSEQNVSLLCFLPWCLLHIPQGERRCQTHPKWGSRAVAGLGQLRLQRAKELSGWGSEIGYLGEKGCKQSGPGWGEKYLSANKLLSGWERRKKFISPRAALRCEDEGGTLDSVEFWGSEYEFQAGKPWNFVCAVRLVGGEGKGIKNHLGYMQPGFIFSGGFSPLLPFLVVRGWSRFILQRQPVQGSLTPTMPFRSHQALKANPRGLFEIRRWKFPRSRFPSS